MLNFAIVGLNPRADLCGEHLEITSCADVRLFELAHQACCLPTRFWTSPEEAVVQAFLSMWAVLVWAADFKKLSTTADYEAIIRDRVSGVPEHWIADIAQQCLHASPSPQGRRHAPYTGLCMPCTCTHAPRILKVWASRMQSQTLPPANRMYLTKQAKAGCPCYVQGKTQYGLTMHGERAPLLLSIQVVGI